MIYYIGNAEYDSDYLEHHGIKGQKWGVLRFQNRDRTWTELGKIRYGSGSGKRRDGSDSDKKGRKPSVMERLFPKRKTKPVSKSEPKKEQKLEAPKKEEPSVSKDRPKTAKSEWSDEELRNRISRAELEKKYNDLMAEKPKEMSNAKKFVLNSLITIGQNLLSTYITNTVNAQKELQKDKLRYAEEKEKRKYEAAQEEKQHSRDRKEKLEDDERQHARNRKEKLEDDERQREFNARENDKKREFQSSEEQRKHDRARREKQEDVEREKKESSEAADRQARETEDRVAKALKVSENFLARENRQLESSKNDFDLWLNKTKKLDAKTSDYLEKQKQQFSEYKKDPKGFIDEFKRFDSGLVVKDSARNAGLDAFMKSAFKDTYLEQADEFVNNYFKKKKKG